MEYGGFRGFYKGILDFIMSNISYVMGTIMILYAIFSILLDMRTMSPGFTVAVNIVPLLFGILILLDAHHSLFFTVGMYAVAIGFSRFVRYLPMEFSGSPLSSLLGLILLYMAANLIYHGIRFLRGNSRAITWVVIGSLFFVLFQTFVLIAVLYDQDSLVQSEDIGQAIVTMFMLLTYIALVSSTQVRRSTNMERLNSILIGFRLTTGTGSDFSLDRGSVEVLKDFFNGALDESMMTISDEGPVYRGTVIHFKDRFQDGTLFLQRWEGPDGPVYLTMSEHEDGSVLGVDTRRIDDVSESGDLLIIRYSDSRTGVFRIRAAREDDGPIVKGIEGAA